jgi:hypothetical protein
MQTRQTSQRNRWKKVEARVAEELSKYFAQYGIPPIKRIPVNGRRGPDIQVMDVLKLVVDVKSRDQVPNCVFPTSEIGQLGSNLISIRLKNLDALFSPAEKEWELLTASLIVKGWYDHIALTKVPNGIPALVLHKTGMRIASSTLIVSKKDLWRINERLTNLRAVQEQAIIDLPLEPGAET